MWEFGVLYVDLWSWLCRRVMMFHGARPRIETGRFGFSEVKSGQAQKVHLTRGFQRCGNGNFRVWLGGA